jgi:hypothetical protein
MMVDFNTSYYVVDYNYGVFLLNDNYDYLTKKTFSKPNYIVNVNSSLYITGDVNIWKTDKYLNILITYSSSGPKYQGILYNCTENLIYVAPYTNTYLQVFDLNLNLYSSTISVSPHFPFSLAENNNELYVGTTEKIVLVVVNKAIIRSFTACIADFISSMVFDKFGLMAIACKDDMKVKLFYPSGTYTFMNFATSEKVNDVRSDSKGRFVVSLINGLRIYF